MSADKKRYSIHDYPEHLNPFSETHLTIQDRRQIIADKLRTPCKNRTWSSKISKRVSRSVSWLEKSLLTTEESPKKPRESQICTEKHEIEHPTHPSPVSRLSKLDARFREECENNSPNRIPQIPPVQNGETSVDQNVTKTELKKRKKRPAPLPPVGDNSSLCSKSEDAESNKHQTESEGNRHSEDTDVVKVDLAITTNENSTNPFDEVITQTCPSDSTEQPVVNDDVSNTEVAQHDMQNLTISEPIESAESKDNAEDAAQNSEDDHKVLETPNSIQVDNKQDANEPSSTANDVTCGETKSDDEVKNDAEHPPITPRRRLHALDENANVSCVKSKPRRDDLLSEMRCNGKAVMV